MRFGSLALLIILFAQFTSPKVIVKMFLSETLILQIEGVTVHLQSGRYSNDMSSTVL